MVHVIGVVADLREFVGATEADEVWRDDSELRREDANYLTIEIAPRWLAVDAENRLSRPCTRAFVHKVHAHTVQIGVVWREGILGQVGETLIGRAKDRHGHPPFGRDAISRVTRGGWRLGAGAG